MKKALLTLAICTSLFSVSKAQYTDMHNFNLTNGGYPYASLVYSAGLLYGTSYFGGPNNVGCIFSIDTSGSAYGVIHNFNDTLGAYPQGTLLLIGNKLYGMTPKGGAHDSGCIFSVFINGSGYKDLYNFNGTKGCNPYGAVILSPQGKLYGMAYAGGTSNFGVVFTIDTTGNNYKVILNFTGANGKWPFGDLILHGNVLYGMAEEGGGGNSGCIFAVDTDGTNYRDLHDCSFAQGWFPHANLILAGATLFGMTPSGGSQDSGCVFSIDTDGNRYNILLNFSGPNGYAPFGSLVLYGDILYGMTSQGGTHDSGCIFRLDTLGNGYHNFWNFTTNRGVSPQGNLIRIGDKLYGLAEAGGGGKGVVFKFDTTLTTSINDIREATGSINVYPNPSNGVFTIGIRNGGALTSSNNTNSPSSNYELGITNSVEVYNVLGEKVYSQLSTSNSHLLIDLSSQSNGVYLYRVVGNSGELIGEGKLLIQK